MKLPSYEKLTTEQGFFSLTPILSRGRHLNAITGKRSTGKSTGTSLYVLLDYLKNGKGWVYTRRTRDEMLETCEHWFDNAVTILRSEGIEINVEYKGGSYYVDYSGETREAGRAIPLSQENKYKGENLSSYNWLIYDEFISKDGRYLGGKNRPLFEYQCLISLMQTMDRDVGKSHRNEVKIICLGNNDSYYNPVFMGCGADRYIDINTHFLAPKGEEFCVQMMIADDAVAAEDYKNSVTYKLSDKRTKEYAYENTAKEEVKSSFVMKVVEPMDPICNLVYDGNKMGMYFSYRGGFFYIDNNVNTGKTYALTADDHTPNYWLAMSATGAEPVKQLKTLYEQGRVRFATNRIKFFIDTYLKYVI